MSDDTKDLSQRGYARHSGINLSLVNRWVRQGKIPTTASGKIDPVIADAALAKNVVRNRGGRRTEAATTTDESPSSLPPGAPNDTTTSLVENQSRRQGYSADLLRVQLDKEAGKACLTERVIQAVGDNQAATAQMLDQMVERCFAQFAAETDPGKVRLMMLAEVREVKAEISNFARSLPERVTATAQ
jgi:hypothetical protein